MVYVREPKLMSQLILASKRHEIKNMKPVAQTK
jgi:hypothetical protein